MQRCFYTPDYVLVLRKSSEISYRDIKLKQQVIVYSVDFYRYRGLTSLYCVLHVLRVQ